MARNRVGVQVKEDHDDTASVETLIKADEDDDVALERKQQKKQKELLRKKKAERRAHAKQRKEIQPDPTPLVTEGIAPGLQIPQDSDKVVHVNPEAAEENGDKEDAMNDGHTLPVVQARSDDEVNSAVTQLSQRTEIRSGQEQGTIPHENAREERRPNEVLSQPLMPQVLIEPAVLTSKPEAPWKDSHEPELQSLQSEAMTVSVEETPTDADVNLRPKKVKKSRAADSDTAATTIQHAMKKSFLKKAKSFLRHSSKVLVEDSPPSLPPINARPVIIPPLQLKPRSPLPSSTASSDGEGSRSSSSESSPTHTLSRESSASSCSTCSGRSPSSSTASETTERSRHHKKRGRRHHPRPGPSVDMLLPPMPTDDGPPVGVRTYSELHDFMATRIQAHIRGMRGRKLAHDREVEQETEIRAEALRELEEEASVRIQAHIKGFLERRRHPKHHHRHHKIPHTKPNSVMPQCMVNTVLRQEDETDKVAEWPEEFDLEPLDTWDELNSIANDAGETVTTSQFLLRNELRVFCGTWNLHAKKPTDDLRLWVPANKYHIVAVGTEECVHSIAKSVVFTSKKQWEDQLKETLGDEYVLVAAHSLTAIHNVVFVHESVLPYVHNIQSDAVATGLGNQLGNKGGVGIAFCVAHTSFAFVNCHFDAHQHNVAKRNANFHRINQELQLQPLATAPQTLQSLTSSPLGLGKTTTSRFSSTNLGSSAALNAVSSDGTAVTRTGSSSTLRRPKRAISECFDRVFWYGDLNYRINGTRRMIDLLLLHNQHAVLRFNDQLRIEMHKGAVFSHFQEGPLHFRPTYKFDKHSNVYDSGPKQRIPSWTDRILYLSNEKPHDIELLSYRSHMHFQTSDHRPVGAVFQVNYNRGAPPPAPVAAEEQGGGGGGGTEAQAFARVLAKGYKPSQSRSEVCLVQ